MKRICLALIFVLIGVGAALAQQNFYSKRYKIGFKYPTSLKLANAENEPEENFKNITGVSVIHPGKGILGATATLGASKIGRRSCKDMPQASIESKIRTKKFGTNTFYRVMELDGGMESVEQYEFYRIYQNSTCYEVRISVGMEKNTPTNDMSAFTKLYAILRSMYFRK